MSDHAAPAEHADHPGHVAGDEHHETKHAEHHEEKHAEHGDHHEGKHDDDDDSDDSDKDEEKPKKRRMVFCAKPDMAEALKKELVDHAVEVRKAAGCDGVRVYQLNADSHKFLVCDDWAPGASKDHYFNKQKAYPHWKAIRAHFDGKPSHLKLRDFHDADYTELQ